MALALGLAMMLPRAIDEALSARPGPIDSTRTDVERRATARCDALPASSDAALVAAMAHGEASSVSFLYDRHGPAVYGLAMRMLNHTPSAEAIVVDAFAAAFHGAGAYPAHSLTVAQWLSGLVRSRAIALIRRRTGS